MRRAGKKGPGRKQAPSPIPKIPEAVAVCFRCGASMNIRSLVWPVEVKCPHCLAEFMACQ